MIADAYLVRCFLSRQKARTGGKGINYNEKMIRAAATRVSSYLRLAPPSSTHFNKRTFKASTASPPPATRPNETARPLEQEVIKSPDFAQAEFKGMSAHFPCLDRLKEKQNAAIGGITGMYGEKVQGYKLFQHRKPFQMKYGGVLPELDIAYEEWGQLNETKDNVILLHTGLSGSSHAKSHDVSRFLVILKFDKLIDHLFPQFA